MMQAQPVEKRPRSLTVLAVVLLLLGGFAIRGGVVHLLFGVGALVSFSGTDVNLQNLANSLGDLFAVEGLILVVAAAGVLRVASWGWKLSVGIVLVGIITSVPVLVLGSVAALPFFIHFFPNLALLYFLVRSKTRAYFKPKANPTEATMPAS
jgi:hypothetical protein